jgi:hypothetical protein
MCTQLWPARIMPAIGILGVATLVFVFRPASSGATAGVGKTQQSPARAYAVVDTGQVKCYDEQREVPCPADGQAFHGQDAQVAGAVPGYVDNGDGTVADRNTGLVWQKSPGAKVTFTQAVAGARSVSLGGQTDWRLPTIKELYSLIVFSGLDPSGSSGTDTSHLVPFIDTRYFDFQYGDVSAGQRIIDAQYWSSTEYVSTTMGRDATVFGVNFADGRIKGYPRDRGPNGQAMREFVRYVSGNPSYGVNDFVDNGDGTVTDRATGLMWQQADSGAGYKWRDALAYAQDLVLAGHDDWRLPNAKELQSIVDYTRSPATTHSAAIDPLFQATSIKDEGGRINYPFYWASTTHANMGPRPGSFAAYVAFGEALGFMQLPPGSGNTTLLDVHGAGAQRSDPKTGNPADWPQGNGPQGDVVRIFNYVRAVRDAGEIEPTAIPPTVAPPTLVPPTATPTATEPPTVEPPTAVRPTAVPPRWQLYMPMVAAAARVGSGARQP